MKPYRLINLTFAGILVLVFIYLYLYPLLGFAVQCSYREVYGIDCPSCGITRGMAAIVRGNIDEGMAYNSNALLAFFFFTTQLPARIFLFFILKNKSKRTITLIAVADSILSVFLLIYCFKAFLVF